jgi:hypothetical protein
VGTVRLKDLGDGAANHSLELEGVITLMVCAINSMDRSIVSWKMKDGDSCCQAEFLRE